jgi:hypothetical protein
LRISTFRSRNKFNFGEAHSSPLNSTNKFECTVACLIRNNLRALIRQIIKCPGSFDGTSKNEITCKYANEQFRRPTPDPKKIQNKQIAPPAAFFSFPGEGKPEGHIYPRLRDHESVRATCRGVEGRRARRSIDGTRNNFITDRRSCEVIRLDYAGVCCVSPMMRAARPRASRP